MGGWYAVLTGDIVRSTDLSTKELRAVQTHLEKCSRDLDKVRDGLLRGSIDFYRGDGWQLLLTAPALALRAALLLRAELIAFKKVDTRISIGVGAVRGVVGRRMSQSTGEAFQRSGQALEDTKRRDRLTISLPEGDREDQMWLSVILCLCDALVQRWTSRQAQAVSGALRSLTQAEIATRCEPRVTQQSVAKALRAADWYAIEAALERFETCKALQP
jgi:hypothetical protein